MNKKTMIIGAICLLAAVALGIYFLNGNKGNNFIDLEEGQEKVCNINSSQQSLLLAYTSGSDTYIAVAEPQSNEVMGTCELPFENNENIYMSQNQSGDLYVYNDAGELFRYNGSHFVKIPSNFYSGNNNVLMSLEGNKMILNTQAGSMKIDKTYTYANHFTIKNAYLYSDLQERNTLNLYEITDPGKEITGNFITLRVKANEEIYYVIYDADTRELLRCIANPFETADGAFSVFVEEDKNLLAVGGQIYDINANGMIEHDAVNIDEAAVAIEYGPYNEEDKSEAVKLKASNAEVYTYIIQSCFTAEYGYVMIK